MRFYAIGNYYLSSIQQGIQAAHTLAELAIMPEHRGVFDEWAKNHKTMVVLNGGNADGLRKFYELLSSEYAKSLPFAKFNEDAQSLDGALTSVGVIVNERIYSANWINGYDQTEGWWQAANGERLHGWESDFAAVLNCMPLAR